MEEEGGLGDAKRDNHRKWSTEDDHDRGCKCSGSRLAVDMMVAPEDDPGMGVEDAGSDGSDSAEVEEAVARPGRSGGKDRSGRQVHHKAVAHMIAGMVQVSGS